MDERLRLPAEWELHEACWLAFPHVPAEWTPHLKEAQQSLARLARTIAGAGGETVRLLVKDDAVESVARGMLGHAPGVELIRADYGDCWVRDTVPLFGYAQSGALGGLCFRFNGWGGKFSIPGDDQVGAWVTAKIGARRYESELVLEGGALETNGRGTFLTTASCTLNENRNPGLTRLDFEIALASLVEVERVVWIERGLPHDHTDGHVDMIARFVAENTVFCMAPNASEPNEVLEEVRSTLEESGLEVIATPAPRGQRGATAVPLPATYCNFYVANEAVIVPTYGVDEDERALRELGKVFVGREVVGLPAADLLWGGGAFHCVTQPQPASP